MLKRNHTIQRPNNPPAVPLNVYLFPPMTELLQIHLMHVHVTKGVARPIVTNKRAGAQIQKRKMSKTLPENFDSIYFSYKSNICSSVLGCRKPANKEAMLPSKTIKDIFIHKTDVLNRINLYNKYCQ
jgi:hypothetical protein